MDFLDPSASLADLSVDLLPDTPKVIIVLAAMTLLINISDLISDWYNYIDFQMASSENMGQASILNYILLGLVCLSTILFLLEISYLHALVKNRTDYHKLIQRGNILSFFLLILEDLPISVVLLVASLTQCHMQKQLFTFANRIATTVTVISLLWKITMIVKDCCCKWKDTCGFLWDKVMRGIIIFMALLIAVYNILMAFQIIGKIPITVTFHQNALLQYKYVNSTEPTDLVHNYRVIKTLNAPHLTLNKLLLVGNEGMSIQSPCESVTDYPLSIVQMHHRQYLDTHQCTFVAKFVIKDNSIKYNLGYGLKHNNLSACYQGNVFNNDTTSSLEINWDEKSYDDFKMQLGCQGDTLENEINYEGVPHIFPLQRSSKTVVEVANIRHPERHTGHRMLGNYRNLNTTCVVQFREAQQYKNYLSSLTIQVDSTWNPCFINLHMDTNIPLSLC